MNPNVRTPSVPELVAILSSSEATVIIDPVPPTVANLPRPAWWLRLLLLVALILLGLFALFAIMAAQVLGDVQRLSLIQRQAAVPALHPALPAAELLLEPKTFAAALQRHPDEAGHLRLARASLLLSADRRAEAVDEFAAAAKTVIGLPAAQRLSWAELLSDLERPEEAGVVLQTIATANLDADQRSRVAALTGRCLLAQRRTP